jgi:hypothetical protein
VRPSGLHHRPELLALRLEGFLEQAERRDELIGDRKIDLRPLISATYPLSQLADAFEAALRKDFYRVLVQPDAEFRSAHQRGKTAPERT